MKKLYCRMSRPPVSKAYLRANVSANPHSLFDFDDADMCMKIFLERDAEVMRWLKIAKVVVGVLGAASSLLCRNMIPLCLAGGMIVGIGYVGRFALCGSSRLI